MFNKYVEILFALYISEGEATLGWLADFRGGDDREASLYEVQQIISVMASAGLVRLFLRESVACVALTENGNRLALMAAELLSGRMMEDWQQAQTV